VFIIAMYTTFKQFADFGGELLYQQVLEAPVRCCEIGPFVKVEVSKFVSVTKQVEQRRIRDKRWL
jgi:hypothetical protein